MAQALKAAKAQTAAAAAKAAGAASEAQSSSNSAPSQGDGGGTRAGGGEAGTALADIGEVGGDWARARNRISAQRHRDAGTRAPKRYRKQVDDYFRRVARESQEGEK